MTPRQSTRLTTTEARRYARALIAVRRAIAELDRRTPSTKARERRKALVGRVDT